MSDDRGPERSKRLLWVLGGLVAVVLVAGAVAGALRGPARLDPDSPEGAVQGYLEAVLDEDYELAAGYFSQDLARECSASDFRDAFVDESLTVTLDDVRLGDGRADVRVRFRAMAGDAPLGAPDYSYEENFTVVDEGGAWRLHEEPWPIHFCGDR